MGTPAPGWSPMILGSLSLRTVAGSAVPRGSGGGYSCSWVPLALLFLDKWTMFLNKYRLLLPRNVFEKSSAKCRPFCSGFRVCIENISHKVYQVASPASFKVKSSNLLIALRPPAPTSVTIHIIITTLYQNKTKSTWRLLNSSECQIHIFTQKPGGFTMVWA